jgi:nucleotide-binding universal stress UspA family protein
MTNLPSIAEANMASNQEGCYVLVAIDDSPQSKRALQWAVRNSNVIGGNDELHLLVVLPPPPIPVAPTAPMATAGLLAAQSMEQARKREEQEAAATLSRARELVLKMGVSSLFQYIAFVTDRGV